MPSRAGGRLRRERVAQPHELVRRDVVTDEPAHLVDVPRLARRRPVWAGFTTATLLPRSRTTAARAAVAIVLPTPVPVPVTTTTDVSERGSATRRGDDGEHLAGPVEICPAWSACAVSRSRDDPSGVDGGRKHPTGCRAPRARSTASTASCGPGIAPT